MKILIFKITFLTILSILIYLIFTRPLIIVEVKDNYIIFTDRSTEEKFKRYCEAFDNKFNYNNYKCKFGLMDTKGKVFYNTDYDYIQILDQIIVLINEKEIKIIDKENPKKVITKYDKTYQVEAIFNDALVITSQNKKLIIADKGKEIYINPEYKTIPFYKSYFHNGLGIISLDKQGLINKEGNLIVDTIYDRIGIFNENFKVCTDNISCGIVNNKGEYLDEPFYKWIEKSPQEGYYIVEKDFKKGLIKDNKIIIDIKYNDLTYLNDNKYLASNGLNRFYVINDQNEVVDLNYMQVFPSDQYLKVLSNDRKYGYIDFGGKVLVEPIYDDTIYLNQNVIGVKKDNKWGIIDINGNINHDFIYDELDNTRFNNRLLIIKLNNFIGLIDPCGKEVLKPIYQEIRLITDIIFYRKDNSWTIMNTKGDIILDQITNLNYKLTNEEVLFLNDHSKITNLNTNIVINVDLTDAINILINKVNNIYVLSYTNAQGKNLKIYDEKGQLIKEFNRIKMINNYDDYKIIDNELYFMHNSSLIKFSNENENTILSIFSPKLSLNLTKLVILGVIDSLMIFVFLKQYLRDKKENEILYKKSIFDRKDI